LREEVLFENGRITNGTFTDYEVPRFADLPELDVLLIDRSDQPPAGAGETPIMAVAPAIANALFHATGTRVRQMPIRWGAATG
jgi:isoquinoline 1-oxidoreductase